MPLLHEVRTGLRALGRRPLFVLTAVVTLGLGIGAGVGVFSVVEAALFRPLPFEDADRLVVVWGVDGPERDIRGASPVEIQDWDRGADAVGPLVRYDETTLNVSGDGVAGQLEAELVGPGFFRVLGAAPALGRTILPEDDAPGAAGSAVISHALWRTRYGESPDAVGRLLWLDGVGFTVVGVMPEGFRGLSFDTDIWVPLGPFVSAPALTDRGGRWLAAVGRLAPGASAETAQEQLSAVAGRLAETYPDTNRGRDAMLIPLRDYYVGPSRSLLLMVLGGVAALLLIACANVANLQLVRAVERGREVGVRVALGAGRWRVAGQLMVESLLLALMGGAAGVALAWLGLKALLPLVPAGVLPPYAHPGIDPVVLGFGLATAAVTGVLFGLAPALRAGRQDPVSALRGGGRGFTTGLRGARHGRRPGAQQAIIVAQVAMALTLLAGAGLAVRSLRKQLAIEPGFDARGVLVARASLAGAGYERADRAGLADRLVEALSGIAGVERAALVSDAPLRGRSSASYIYRAEDSVSPETRIRFYRHSVTPGAFAALGVPVVRGRGFDRGDRAESPGVVVVSEAFAARVWPGRDAVGRRVVLGSDTAEVIGVAGTVHQRDLTTSLMDPGQDPDVYFAYAQVPTGSFDLVVRTAGDPGALAGAVRRELARIDPAVPLFDVAALDTVLRDQTSLQRLVSSLLAVFGALALVVAAVGIYGVLAFVVRGRRREIAIRAALGAHPAAILRLVLGQGLRLAGIGVALGLAGALAAGRVASSFLYGVGPADPLVLAATVAALLGTAALAAFIPGRQATRVDPHTALQE